MIQTSDALFPQDILQADGVVLVDFWAPWCGPCQMMSSILEEVDKEAAGKCLIAKLNVDENPQTAGTYALMKIPTLIIFKKGEEVGRIVGLSSKEEIVGKLSAHTE